jgi:hypothetical protein
MTSFHASMHASVYMKMVSMHGYHIGCLRLYQIVRRFESSADSVRKVIRNV